LPRNVLIPSLGTVAIIISILFFPALLSGFPVIRTELIPAFEQLAYASFLLMLVGLMGVSYGIVQFVKDTPTEHEAGSITEMIVHVLTTSIYARVFAVITVGYALFYSVVSSTLAFRPSEIFSEQYGAAIPSIVTALCCGPIGQIPRFTVYLTEQIGFLIIPINILLLSLVSPLVGLNGTLALFSYRQSLRKSGSRWGGVGGFGAFMGLFTACPSCAALFFASGIGGAAALSLAASLASFQTLFVGISVPVLVLTPYLISRSILRAYGGACPLPEKSNSTDLIGTP